MLSFSEYDNAYIDEADLSEAFQPRNIRPFQQIITQRMNAFSERVANTNDPQERDEMLALLALCNGALTLLNYSALEEDIFAFQRAKELLRNIP